MPPLPGGGQEISSTMQEIAGVEYSQQSINQSSPVIHALRPVNAVGLLSQDTTVWMKSTCTPLFRVLHSSQISLSIFRGEYFKTRWSLSTDVDLDQSDRYLAKGAVTANGCSYYSSVYISA